MPIAQVPLRGAWAVVPLLGMTALLVMIGLTDRHYGLYAKPTTRYRIHAIPVALSNLYHGHRHDYTGDKQMANAFYRAPPEMADHLIRWYANPATPVGSEIYYWSADDRGLADYVMLAFWVFGPKLVSLSSLYLLILTVSVGLFIIGYWRSPATWVLPVGVLFGHLFLLHAYQFRGQVELADGSIWGEEIALYESRTFELLAALPWFHLALLAAARPACPRTTWITSIPQAAIVLFLYHARSTIGWQYLALLAVAGAAAARAGWARWRGWDARAGLARPVAVGLLVVGSLAALAAYKRAVYHPAYYADRGARTFWHNALIGFTYHPGLRDRYQLRLDDAPVLHWIARDAIARGDPRYTPAWCTATFTASSLGEETDFDWTAYEATARGLYMRTWKAHPGDAVACYGYYKPRDAACQVAQVTTLTVTDHHPGRSGHLGPGAVVALVCLAVLVLRPSAGARPTRRVVGVFLVFSVIPSLAFYASLATMSGLYLGLTLTAVCAIDAAARGIQRLAGSPTGENGGIARDNHERNGHATGTEVRAA